MSRSLKKAIDEAVKIIVKFYSHSKSKNNPWLNQDYRQGLRDALETLKKAGVVKDYDLSEEEEGE